MMSIAAKSQRKTVKQPSERILGYDVARSLAMLGMIVVHFGLVMAADATRPAWSAMIMHLLDGRAAATFVVLAGVGLTLTVPPGGRRPTIPARSPRCGRRSSAAACFLLAMGFVNLVIWPGDILRVYGVSLIVAAGLITASDRRLLVVAFGFILGFLILLLVVDYETNWDWSTLTYHGLWTLRARSATSSTTAFAACSPGPGS